MSRRIEEKEPLARIALTGHMRQIGAESVVINECAPDPLVVKDHPHIERCEVKDG